MNSLPPLNSSSSRRGMTLLELLLVIVVMAVLLAILVPSARSMYENSRQVRCANNLRSVGVVFHHYAAERNGAVRFLRDGSGSPMWYNALRDQAGYTEEAAQKAFGCPKDRWQDVGPWRCYGMRLNYFTVPIAQDAGFPMERTNDAGYYGFRLSRVTEPGKFFIMADSALASGAQSFRIADRKLYSGGGACLRHRERCNVLFLDGHVEALGPDGLKALNFTQVLDGEYRTKAL